MGRFFDKKNAYVYINKETQQVTKETLKNLDPQMHVQQENNNAPVADEVDPELLAKVLANPETVSYTHLI